VTERAVALARAWNDRVLLATALSLRADALRRSGDLVAALASANEAEYLQGQWQDRWRALTLLRRAEILEAMGRLGDAIEDARAARALAEHHGERDLAIGAKLLETLHRAMQGTATPEAVRAALAEAEAAEQIVTLRALTRAQMVKAREWLPTEAQ
jgi:tetratricopeptide (TPR) repeat protein